MIVREIARNPDLVDIFDWFNDYRDTRAWLLGTSLAGRAELSEDDRTAIVARLEAGYASWLEARHSI